MSERASAWRGRTTEKYLWLSVHFYDFEAFRPVMVFEVQHPERP
jgi:hypothetical protein